MARLLERLLSLEMNMRGGTTRAIFGRAIRRLWPDFRLSRALLRLTGSEQEVRVSGKRIFVDLRDNAVSGAIFLKREWSPAESRLLARILKRGDVFLDIGANIGYFSLLASEAVGKTGAVYAFEPDADNVRLLRKNVRVNGCTNVRVEAKAVAEMNRAVTLYLSTVNFGDHRIFTSHDDNEYNEGRSRRGVNVEGVALDAYFPPGQRVDVIKMDIQGAEYFALQGMKRLLKDNHDVVLMLEFWPHGLREAGCDPEQFLRELRELGFFPHLFRADKLVRMATDELLARQEGWDSIVWSRNPQMRN